MKIRSAVLKMCANKKKQTEKNMANWYSIIVLKFPIYFYYFYFNVQPHRDPLNNEKALSTHISLGHVR